MTAAPLQVETTGTVGVPLPRTMTRTRPMDSALKLVDHYFLLTQCTRLLLNGLLQCRCKSKNIRKII